MAQNALSRDVTLISVLKLMTSSILISGDIDIASILLLFDIVIIFSPDTVTTLLNCINSSPSMSGSYCDW